MKSPLTLLAGILLIFGGLGLGVTGTLHLVQSSRLQAEVMIRIADPRGSMVGPNSPLIQSEIATMRSPTVLTNVIAELNLNDLWGKKYNRGQRLSDFEVEKLFRIDFRLIRNTDVVPLKVSADDPNDALMLANAIIKNYRQYATLTKSALVTVISAPTIVRGVSPNRPLAIMSIVAGVCMAIGGIVCLGDSAGGWNQPDGSRGFDEVPTEGLQIRGEGPGECAAKKPIRVRSLLHLERI
jgi:hypothetical protein